MHESCYTLNARCGNSYIEHIEYGCSGFCAPNNYKSCLFVLVPRLHVVCRICHDNLVKAFSSWNCAVNRTGVRQLKMLNDQNVFFNFFIQLNEMRSDRTNCLINATGVAFRSRISLLSLHLEALR